MGKKESGQWSVVSGQEDQSSVVRKTSGQWSVVSGQLKPITRHLLRVLVELPDGRWSAFEIKLGANQIESAARELVALRDAIAKEKDGIPPSVLCVICGMSNAAYRREDGVFVVPITALKN